jgi:hypothetical protein
MPYFIFFNFYFLLLIMWEQKSTSAVDISTGSILDLSGYCNNISCFL